MDTEGMIKSLKDKVSSCIDLSVKQQKIMTMQLDWINFSLISFDSLVEKCGFTDYLGNFELTNNPYEGNTADHDSWVNGWTKASKHPYVIQNVEYYRPNR